MYCRYDYNAGATAANIMADLVAILTGASTDSSTLSAGCNKPNTAFINTVSPGWTVHDAAAGSGAQVLKAPFADASGYKYAWFNFTATTYANGLYETWNATTHAGTNAANAAYGATQTAGYSLAAGGTIFVSAAATYMHLLCFTGSTYGMTISVMERTRNSLWDTSGVGVPPAVLVNCGSNGWSSVILNPATAPRTKSAAFADLTGVSAVYFVNSMWGQISYTSGNGSGPVPVNAAKTPDAAGVAQYAMTDLYVQYPSRGDMGGMLYGLKQVSTGGNTSDDVSVSGQTWFYLASLQVGGASSPCLCFPKF